MLDASGFFLNECFFPSFGINDMHVQTIFIEDLENPLASVNCYFGLYIKTKLFIPTFADSSRGGRAEDDKEGIMLKARFLSAVADVLRQRRCVCDFGRPKKLVHFVVVFTLKRVDSLCVVYFTRGFLQKKGDNNDTGSFTLLHTHEKEKAV